MGALRAGIYTVIIPAKNKRDLSEIPKNVKRRIKFVPVSNMDQVLELALEKPLKMGKPVRTKIRRSPSPTA